MGLFNYLKKAFTSQSVNSPYTSHNIASFECYDLTPSERALLSKTSQFNTSGGNITPALYQQLRAFEMDWLERHYDFNTLEGIFAIPVTKDLPSAPSPQSSIKRHTGEVYYYLRHKAYKHEEAGNAELALACMRKSVALVMCRNSYSIDDCYPLVKMLARFGFLDEAYSKKREIDKVFGISKIDDSIIKAELKRRQELIDFEWLQANLPDKCPKSISSYRRMKTQNTKNYQLLKQISAELDKEI